MTQNEYNVLVKYANGGEAPTPAPVINGVTISTTDLAKLAVTMIDQYNLAGAGKASKNQYSIGNDCAMPDCFVSGSYLDGIYQEFKPEFSDGWPTVQPTFKLDMNASVTPEWNGTDAIADEEKLVNPNYATLASGYNQASAFMPASAAWPKYVEAGRGEAEGQTGYAKSAKKEEASESGPTEGGDDAEST